MNDSLHQFAFCCLFKIYIFLIFLIELVFLPSLETNGAANTSTSSLNHREIQKKQKLNQPSQ
jgi:hypothetical protein